MITEEGLNNVESVVEKWAKRIYAAVLESKDNPTLLGLELISLSTAIKIFKVDFVVWDFSGNHVLPPGSPPPKDPSNPPAGTTPSQPEWMQQLFGFSTSVQKLFNPFTNQMPVPTPGATGVPPTPLGELVSAVSTWTPGTIVGQILKDLGIPMQITLSEVLFFAGAMLLSEPLLKMIGEVGAGLASKAPGIGIG